MSKYEKVLKGIHVRPLGTSEKSHKKKLHSMMGVKPKEKVKTKVIYRNKDAEKRSKAFDKKVHEAGEKKKHSLDMHSHRRMAK